MAKREFLQLAHTFEDDKYGIGSWFMSEKLDGMRAFWDGGITRGLFTDQVPFANTAKDARLLVRQKSTGLWSRYGKAIQAPDWWLDQLPPNILLDGELYAGRGQFQTLISIAKNLSGGSEWQEVGYVVFDSPPAHIVFGDGKMDNTNFKKLFSGVLSALGQPTLLKPDKIEFEHVISWLKSRVQENEVVWLHEQTQLPWKTAEATAVLYDSLAGVSRAGGEGIILRAPHSRWLPERTRTMLKAKFTRDAEGTVVGYTWGRETDKGSKLLGLMGALILTYNNRRFELSGFTEEERKLWLGIHEYDRGLSIEVGTPNQGKECEMGWHNKMFPIGSKVSFKYRELTDAGLPKEARYWRKK